MMWSVLTLLLLSAEPGPSLAVVSTAEPGLEKTASEAGRALGARLEAPYVELGGYLKSHGPECARALKCLVAAPEVASSTRLLHLRLRALASGQLAADLRLLDLQERRVRGRSASVVEPKQLAAWVEKAATRLVKQADPHTKKPPPSPFARKPSSAAPAEAQPAEEDASPAGGE